MYIDDVCSDLAWRFQSRYMRVEELHVSDALTCPIKVFLNRIFSSSEKCHAMARMMLGKAWERIVMDALSRDFQWNKVFRGEVEYSAEYSVQGSRSVEGKVKLIATPDFWRSGEIIEAKYTSWGINDVANISASHYDTMRNLDMGIPELSGISPDHAWLPAFYGWVTQVATYVKATRSDKASIIAIYRDAVDELSLSIDKLDPFYSLWKEYLPLTILSLELAKLWFRMNSKVSNQRYFLKQLVYLIWSKAIHTKHLLKYFQCEDCPYWRMGTCPSLPTIKVPDRDDQYRIIHLLSWLREMAYEAKVDSGYDKAIKETEKELARLVSREWLRTLRQPIGAIQVTLERRGRPTYEEKALAKRAQLQEAEKSVDIWRNIKRIKVPTKWLMREMQDLGKIPLTPDQIAYARGHGDVVERHGVHVLIPSPTSEDYTASKQTLYIWLKYLLRTIPEPRLNIRVGEVLWVG